MMDVIAGAYSSLKTAAEITQGLVALKTDAAVSSKAVELNGVIFAVQQQLFEAQAERSKLLDSIRNLEAEIAALKQRELEEERYELVELSPGTFVYRLKVPSDKGEPLHLICPNCLGEGVKRILQFGHSPGLAMVPEFTCNRCKAKFHGDLQQMRR